MTEFLRLLLDAIAYIWPLRMVKQWERGGYYVFGRWWREVGPGIYPVIPWFTDVTEATVVEAIANTDRLDITLSDGSLLSFSASATIRVHDIKAALNDVEEYRETCQEALSAVLSDRLAAVDAARLEHSSRKRLLTDLLRWVQEDVSAYGVTVTKLRFRSFILNAKAHRFITDQQSQGGW